LTARTIRKFRIGPSLRIESRIGRTIRNRIESRSFAGPYLLGLLNKILETSDSEVGLKTEKSGGATGGEGECGEVEEELLASERRSLDIYAPVCRCTLRDEINYMWL